MRPHISVVIPAYNEEKFLANCLESLLKQDIPLSQYEIIVVNNGSTDKTKEIAKKYNVIVIDEPTLGIARARQTGFLKAKAPIIASIDSDSIAPENWLNYFITAFNQNKNLVGLSGLFDFYDSTKFLHKLTIIGNNFFFNLYNWHSGSNLAVRKDAFLKIGGFNIELNINEEGDLFKRLKKIGIVERHNNFKVLTSARRYIQLGFWRGSVDCWITYFSVMLGLSKLKNKRKFLASQRVTIL